MAITAYVGYPGSGKSYSVVKHVILPALEKGRHVVTNIPLHLDAVNALGYGGVVESFPVEVVEADPDRIYDFVTPGCVFVLDEAWRLFPAGGKADKVPAAFKKLVAEHRHMVDGTEARNSVEIVLVVQDLANVGAFARRLVDKTYVTTKLDFVGLNKRYRVDIYQGAVTGANPPTKNRLRAIGPSAYEAKYFAMYQSHTLAASDGSGANEARVDGRANILKRPAFMIGAVLVPVMIFGGIHLLRTTMDKVRTGRTPAASPADAAAAPSVRAAEQRGQTGGFTSLFAAPAAATARATPRLIGERFAGGERGAYFTDGYRVTVLSGSACFGLPGHMRCKWNGDWYDAAGLIPGGAPDGKPSYEGPANGARSTEKTVGVPRYNAPGPAGS